MSARAVALTFAAACALGVARAEEPAAPPPLVPPNPQDDYDRLGKLERQEVDAVLAERSLKVDRAPAGKTIGEIIVAPREVFAPSDGGFLRFFNIFHATTREGVVRRELLFTTGDVWDPAIIDETLRNLRNPLYHNVLVIVPLESAEAGRVDVLVVVRDIWSLRFNSNWEVQDLDLINLTLSLSENNLFGRRKRAAFTFFMDQGTVQVGPTYTDPNIAGTRLTLRSAVRLVMARHGGELEGTRSDTTFAYPIWSLRRKWGASLAVSHVVGIERRFKGTTIRQYDNPDTMTAEMVDWKYKRRELITDATVARAFGSAIRQTVSVGHELVLQRPAVTDDFMGDDVLRAAFARDVLPRSELSSSLFAGYELYTPVYGAYRDLDTFDFREDYQLGPLVTARATAALPFIGSEQTFVRLSGSARWSSGWAGGLWRASAGTSVRLEDGEAIDRTTSMAVLAVTPALGRLARLVLSLGVDWLTDDTQNRFFGVGATSGLRGYQISEFIGKARAVGHLEARTRPLRLGFFRAGAVAFWDAGDAADTLGELRLHHAVGVGLRTLIPQIDPLVMRFDWAIPLGAGRGFPGRVSLGFEQAF